MAEQVRVVVSVDKSKLNELKTDIGKIDGKHIKIQTTFDKDGKVKRNVETINVGLGKTEQIVTSIGKKGETVTRTLTQDMKKASLAGDLLGDSLTRIIGKMAAWQILGNLISAVIGSLKTAVSTLKEVDSALVTIRKTTDYTEAQIEKLTETTYELASAYGRTADELLNLSATFARAGMGDQLEQMTELAALLENVGDIEGDTAAKFILAANAAWKLGGNYDSLMQIIDGMNAVTNKAAVDMAALTTGITVSGSVFANAGESAQTYTALVGTAVAATQRSGAEIARGLRTIAMNVRAIKGELEDGEIIDDSTISDAAKALASVGINTADARGELRLTSDVLADLAGKWDSLTTAEQSYLAQSLAGKRQANILTALMQNWGEVERQMALYANGAGSALRENELYLDSWEAKSKQLSASWTQFISHLIDTGMVKSSLDILNVAVEALDTDVGRAAITVGGLTAAVVILKAALDGLKMTAGGSAFLESLFSPTTLAVAGAVTAVYLMVTAVDALTVTYKEQKDALAELQRQYDATYGENSEFADLTNRIDELNEDELKRLGVIEQDRIKAEKDLAKQREDTFDAWRKEQIRSVVPLNLGRGGEQVRNITYAPNAETTRATIEEYKEFTDAVNNLNEEQKEARITAEEYHRGLYEILEAHRETAEAVQNGIEIGKELFDEEQRIYDLYQWGTQVLGEYAAETIKAANSTKPFTVSLKSQVEIFGEVSGKANVLIDAMDAMDESGGIAHDTMNKLVELFPALAEGLKLTSNGWVTAKDNLEKYYKALSDTYDLEVEEAFAALQISAIKDLGEEFGNEYDAVEAAELANLRGESTGSSAVDAAAASYSNAVRNRDAARRVLENLRKLKKEEPKGSGDTTDKALENRKDAVALLKQQYEYLSASGASERELVEKAWEIQKALKSQSAYMKSIGADEKDILSIETEWWSWQNKITKLIEDADDTLSRLKDSLAEAKESSLALLDAQEESAVGPLQAQLDLLKAQRDTVEDTRKEEERRLAVEEARLALENAQRERNVRQYNALTGQWEWAANASAVEKAQKDLADANKALADYYTDREIEALEAQIKTVQTAYDALRDSVNDFSKAIDKGTLSFLDALTYFTEAASRAGLSGMAGDLAAAYMNAGESTVLAKMKENGAKWGAASAAEKKILEDENWRLGTSQGWTRIEGAWYDKAGNRLYDTGGILHGRGAIKATGADEMILPPGMTAALLNAEQNGAFEALLSHLGIMTGAAQTFAGFGGFTSSRIGSQHNGDVYEIGGITLSEAQARGMTVFDLAQMARTLSLHNAS